MKRVTALLLCIVLILNLCGCAVADFFGSLTIITEVATVEEYYIVSPQFDACYNTLNSKQKKIYRILYSAANEMTDGYFSVGKNYDGVKTDISLAYKALIYDHPEFFWMPSVYLVSKKDNIISPADAVVSFNRSTGKTSASYLVKKSERDKMQAELDKKVDEILSKVKPNLNEYEIEKFFNDYICENTVYDNEKPILSYTAYGCLVSGKAVCEGYSKAFKLLCNKADIECDLIVGEGQGEGHMWNTVNIDGKHSYVDVTWNDSNDGTEHIFFNITTSQLEYDHDLSPLYTALEDAEIQKDGSYNYLERDCGYTGNTYYEREGRTLDDFAFAETAAAAIKEDSSFKRNSSFLLSREQQEEFSKDESKYIAKIQKRLKGIELEEYLFYRDILILYFSVYA